jgi:hypothetical protein
VINFIAHFLKTDRHLRKASPGSQHMHSGGTEMIKKALIIALAGLLTTAASVVIACDYKSGETKFVEYANCRYGEDGIVVVDLPEGSSWDNCVYHLQAFMPEKLLAVTKERDGKEEHSINARGNIGNPCYLTKKNCDTALKAFQSAQQ